ncbi:MAG TPA: hypothetical protein VL307_07670 [Chitinophagaceae bacterium]|jgi:thiol-disulfide isomerase/thioredoxin|nr:hypothetical protein [Chitinophagaceae bacterium]
MIKAITFGPARIPGPLTLLLSTIGLFPVVLSKDCDEGNQPLTPSIMEHQLSALEKANTWFNSTPLTAASLKGKVVLVAFCTYTCINWLRALPYVREWQEKYKDQGLIVIAVHTPEFIFERNIDNVRRSVGEMKIGFPIAVDNEYKIWNAFNNQYWPAIYLLDAKGRSAHHQFGEGGYEKTEQMIQHLLKQAGAKNIAQEIVPVRGKGVEATADWNNLGSQENYLGYERTESFSSRGGKVADKSCNYHIPSNFKTNQWAIAGNWTMKRNSVILNNANGKIVYRFHARDLHVVMGASSGGTNIRFRVLIDGKPPGQDRGLDIDEQGNGVLNEQRLYQLVRQNGPITDRTFEIEFFDIGAEAFSFTFG